MATEHHTSRRTVLKGAPVALMAALVAGDVDAAVVAAIAPDAETPVMAMFRQWQRYSEWLNSHATDDAPETELNALVNVRVELENDMLDTPAERPLDFVAKIVAYTSYGDGEAIPRNVDMPDLWAEARALLGVVA